MLKYYQSHDTSANFQTRRFPAPLPSSPDLPASYRYSSAAIAGGTRNNARCACDGAYESWLFPKKQAAPGPGRQRCSNSAAGETRPRCSSPFRRLVRERVLAVVGVLPTMGFARSHRRLEGCLVVSSRRGLGISLRLTGGEQICPSRV